MSRHGGQSTLDAIHDTSFAPRRGVPDLKSRGCSNLKRGSQDRGDPMDEYMSLCEIRCYCTAAAVVPLLLV